MIKRSPPDQSTKPILSKQLSRTKPGSRQWTIAGTLGAGTLASVCYLDLVMLHETLLAQNAHHLLFQLPRVESLSDLDWHDGLAVVRCVQLLERAGLTARPWAGVWPENLNNHGRQLFSVCHRFRTKDVGC
jgi:hypothetical protein